MYSDNLVVLKRYSTSCRSFMIEEKDRYDFIPYASKRFPKLVEWQNKIVKYLVKKGVLKQVRTRHEEESPLIQQVEISLSKLEELIMRDITMVLSRYGEVECVILGRDVEAQLCNYYRRYDRPPMYAWQFNSPGREFYVPGNADEFGRRHDRPIYFAGCPIKVIPWFEGVIVVPKLD